MFPLTEKYTAVYVKVELNQVIKCNYYYFLNAYFKIKHCLINTHNL